MSLLTLRKTTNAHLLCQLYLKYQHLHLNLHKNLNNFEMVEETIILSDIYMRLVIHEGFKEFRITSYGPVPQVLHFFLFHKEPSLDHFTANKS